MSDWNAQHTTTGSANGGLDMTMPGRWVQEMLSCIENPDFSHSDFNKKNVLWGPGNASRSPSKPLLISPPALQSAVSGGQVQQSRLDDMVKRILASWYLVGQDKSYPTASFNSWKIGTQNVGGNHKTNVRAMARDGIVLLKNTDGALPLSKPKSIAVIGSDAGANSKGMNGCAGMCTLRIC